MTEIDRRILQAWKLVRPTRLTQPAELAKRLARRQTPLLTRPPRAWCLAARANDQRIEAPLAHIRTVPHDDPLTASLPHCFTVSRPERVTLATHLLYKLIRPVETLGRADLHALARKLGTTCHGLRNARANLSIESIYTPAHKGKPTPLLYTPRLLDPCARGGFFMPDRAWTWTTDYLIDRVPPSFEETLTRIPIYKSHVPDTLYAEHRHPEIDPLPTRKPRPLLPKPGPDIMAQYKWKGDQYIGYDWRAAERNPRIREQYERHERTKQRNNERARKKRRENPPPSQSTGSLHFAGWMWLCPSCQKPAMVLYLPLPPVNLLADHLGPLTSTNKSHPVHIFNETFACGQCHRVKFFSRVQSENWNDIIAHLTVGLLYGREVPKPDWYKHERKREYKPLINARPAEKRQQVRALMLEGYCRPEIASQLSMTKSAVDQQAWKIFKQERVRSHKGLLAKHNKPLPERLLPSSEKIRRLIVSGLSQAQIATEMGITKQAVQNYTHHLRRTGELPQRSLKRDNIAKLLAEGLTPKEIAQRLGCKLQQVYDHAHELRRAGRAFPPKPETKQQEVLRRLGVGQSYKEIAAEMSLSLRAVYLNAHYGRKNAKPARLPASIGC